MRGKYEPRRATVFVHHDDTPDGLAEKVLNALNALGLEADLREWDGPFLRMIIEVPRHSRVVEEILAGAADLTALVELTEGDLSLLLEARAEARKLAGKISEYYGGPRDSDH